MGTGKLDNTIYGRQPHGCTVGSYLGQEGIFVTGGSNRRQSGNTKVEFLIDSVKKWKILPTMSKDRLFHTASFLGGTILSLGGHGSIKDSGRRATTSYHR